MDDLIIRLDASPSRLDSRIVSISNPQRVSSYYVLIYESTPDKHWNYLNATSSNTLPNDVLENFLVGEQSHYLLLRGDSQRNNFTFNITAKYPLTYMSAKEYLFHVYYIIPVKFFGFPTFYYSKYYTFFVDPLI